MKSSQLHIGHAALARAVAVTCVALAVGVSFGCTGPQEQDVASSESAQTSDSGAPDSGLRAGNSLAVPRAGTDGNMLAEAEVLAALRKVKAAFYDSQSGYVPAGTVVNGRTVPTSAPPPSSEPGQCLGACPTYFSDIACHYLCWHPSYSAVVPNVRGCVSEIARGTVRHSSGRKMFYPEIYDYCVHQPYDRVLGLIPGYDQSQIDVNKRAGQKPGVLAWIDENEGAEFKHVMFTWYNPFAFDLASQQRVLNAFYGVSLSNPAYNSTDTADVNACNSARPRRPTDSRDGTHCSTARTLDLRDHIEWGDIYEFMAKRDAPPPNTSQVTFSVDQATTVMGESVYLLGDATELGFGRWPDGRVDWRASRAIKMSPSAYPKWSVTVPMTKGKTVKVKFIKRTASGLVVWQSGPDQTFQVPNTPTASIDVTLPGWN